MKKIEIVLILGSAPNALIAKEWPEHCFDAIVAINNAWKIRSDWTHSIFPSDFPKSRQAKPSKFQSLHSANDYVEAQNKFGGFVYAGGTMAFTAAYWALEKFKPKSICFFGCDMVYEGKKTHFYGKGRPDPLRNDITLRSLEAKSARFEAFAINQECTVLNLSTEKESRLTYERATLKEICSGQYFSKHCINTSKFNFALKKEKQLKYFIKDGRYWKHLEKFSPKEIDALDRLWLDCIET